MLLCSCCFFVLALCYSVYLLLVGLFCVDFVGWCLLRFIVMLCVCSCWLFGLDLLGVARVVGGLFFGFVSVFALTACYCWWGWLIVVVACCD